MKDFVKNIEEKIKKIMRLNRLNLCCFLKGSATHETSRTTIPPPFILIFTRRIEYRSRSRYLLEILLSRQLIFRKGHVMFRL